ncbi:hexaprenyldihydroxybenzoate methyltransferase precursor [Purpureocillium lavendulum]|uniref:Ubiquinone biosynthesis O-methyltransferase, mitochondrial n=1 Tax=Purpureocillium lavendulum TaxID=1247861 RepID=A0AB34FUI5_9HYPO|nr:hexaprenyldihydroxybenzoate methyltransferase precursor [Purpureocillium lavendulum]
MAAPSRTAAGAGRLSRLLRPQQRLPLLSSPSSLLSSSSSSSPSCAARPSTRPVPAATPSSCCCRPRWHSSFSSVNPEEVSHFNALAGEWWDPHGSSRLLHLMNPLRHDFIRACRSSGPQHVRDDADNAASLSYLDIGCGGGIFAESAARMPTTRRVVAIDPTPSVLAVAKAHARKDPSLGGGKLTYTQTSIEALPVPASDADRYDVVSLFEVIEHVDEPAAFLARVRPFVKPGGWLVMSTIARTWTSWLTTNLVAEDILGIVPKGTHDWNKYINEDELRRHFLDEGWENPRVMGVVYVPGLGWREVRGSEKVGNYFFGVRRAADDSAASAASAAS